jgi:hypothetical protein
LSDLRQEAANVAAGHRPGWQRLPPRRNDEEDRLPVNGAQRPPPEAKSGADHGTLTEKVTPRASEFMPFLLDPAFQSGSQDTMNPSVDNDFEERLCSWYREAAGRVRFDVR